MPEGLQDADTGQLLQSRADACEFLADEIESAADEVRELEQDADEDDDDDPK